MLIALFFKKKSLIVIVDGMWYDMYVPHFVQIFHPGFKRSLTMSTLNIWWHIDWNHQREEIPEAAGPQKM